MKTTIHTNIGDIIYDAEAAQNEKSTIDAWRIQARKFPHFTRIVLITLFVASLITLVACTMNALSLAYGILTWTLLALAAILHFVAWASEPCYQYSCNTQFWMFAQEGKLRDFKINPPRKNCRWMEPAQLTFVQERDNLPPRVCTIKLGYTSLLCNDIQSHIIDFTETKTGVWYEAACILKNNIDQKSFSYQQLINMPRQN